MNIKIIKESILPKNPICILLLLLLMENCSSLPNRNFENHNFSKVLDTREFTPEKPKFVPPIIIFEPLLLKETALYRIEDNTEKGLIPFLNEEGYTVYLVSSKTKNPDFKLNAKETDVILNQIADKHKNRDVILAGVSLGGQSVLEYMTLPTNLNNFARVKKIFFIGTGIDYNYSNSFLEKSETLGYDEKPIEALCKENKRDNFCSRFIWFNNALQSVDNTKKETFFHQVPKMEKNYISRFHPSKLQTAYFFLYGKLDSISPEESIYPFFHTIRLGASKGNSQNTLYEAGEANGHTIDYDHADLFVYPKAEKEIYSELVDWLNK